jgi:hypothetical protein
MSRLLAPLLASMAPSLTTAEGWTPTSFINAPSGRAYHTAVWTGSEMIVWGGFDASGALGTGGRYNPATNSWAPVSIVNAPAVGAGHTAVWTGTEMLVWGPSNVGARYNPASDKWTSMAPGPGARSYHAAVWTGSEMIIWGGQDASFSYLNTGSRYNPSTDNWTPTSTMNAPQGHRTPPAVWTGTEMIVWGTAVSPASIGRYSPATDTWQAGSSWREAEGVTRVWAAPEMIVWGGRFVTQDLREGARYDAGTNRWAPTSSTNPPSARSSHTAVWTGTDMIIWGGAHFPRLGPDFPTDTGGRYIPSSDLWSATTTAAAPSPRYSHTAVWTGSEMIVWGGRHANAYLSNGGRYDPGSTLSVSDAQVSEGQTEASLLAFDVSLSVPSGRDVVFTYTTSDGSATSPSDYAAASGTFTIPAGATSKRLVVLVKGDGNVEGIETLTLTLSAPTGATIERGTAVGTIVDDDPAPTATAVNQFRLYNDVTKEHLYTTDSNEYAVLGTRGWTQEGMAYNMLTNGVYSGAATTPFFRLYHPGTLQHHWTSDSNEAITLARMPAWFYEGTVGYILPTAVGTTVPLYRLALASPPLHLWTTGQNEYDTLASRGWSKEGTVGYVIP